MHSTLEFQIENKEMRPEFDVLKAYFRKSLKSKSITAEIRAEFEYRKLVAQIATSKDIEHINKGLLGRSLCQKKNILTSDQLQNDEPIYANAEELISVILKL